VLVEDHGPGMQPGARLSLQHLPTNEHRLAGESGEGDSAQDRIRLQDDVVVHEEDLLTVGVLQRLVHHARIAAGAADVGLVDDSQALAQRSLRLSETVLLTDLVDALVRDHHRGHDRADQLVFANGAQGGHAVGGAVERGHTDGHRGAPGRLDRRVPAAGVHDQLRVLGADVEPVPPAVLERGEIQLDVDFLAARCGLHQFTVHEDLGAVRLRTTDIDPALALDVQPQVQGAQRAPVPPVAGRERVEKGREGDLSVLGTQTRVRDSTRTRRALGMVKVISRSTAEGLRPVAALLDGRTRRSAAHCSST